MRLDKPASGIDQSQTLGFSFDGTPLLGHPGDTLASALIANDVLTVGRSVSRGRPRGVVTAGPEEPAAMVRVDHGTHVDPLIPATTIELYDGLRAESTSGKGRLAGPDTARYDVMHHHCDVLVIGGGLAGMSAAEAAAQDGARVLLVDEFPDWGGATRGLGASGDHQDRTAALLASLQDLDEVTLLPRATALALLDGGYAVVHERRTLHLGSLSPDNLARERLWRVRARMIVLATGAVERPLVFGGNDRPGVMLAGAVGTYANRFSVAPGRRAVVFTTNDSAYHVAADLVAAGVSVECLVDARSKPPARLSQILESVGVDVWRDSAVAATQGDDGLQSVSVVPVSRRGSRALVREVGCDFLAVSGGWNPSLALYAHAGGRTRYHTASAAFVAVDSLRHVLLAGRVAGHRDANSCTLDGARAGREAAHICGYTPGDQSPAGAAPASRVEDSPPLALWSVPPLPGRAWDEHFVDIQRDATVTDIHRGVDAGLRSAEHIKRYTTIGTGSDQGKTSVVNALGILAAATGASLDELTPTTFRPPVSPTAFNVLAAHERGPLYDPAQLSPLHRWHLSHGAMFDNSGRWRRPRFFPQDGEGQDAASARECSVVRSAVGLADISTLGKIDVHGPDAAEFLDRMYTNRMSSLAIGSCRYGLLCGADGMIFDDGVVTRLGASRFLATTTTGNAAAVFGHFEHWRQNEWPDLRVHLTRVTDQWAAFAVAGPRARQVLGRITDDVKLDTENFPFLTMREAVVAGLATRLFRISFSGELSFEVHVAARSAVPIWEAILEAGADYGIAPYGTEAMHILRAEKGYIVVGQDTDGTVTPHDAGLGWLVNSAKPFFVGKRSHSRPDAVRSDRLQLVGLLPDATDCLLPEGAQILVDNTEGKSSSGHVTSSYRSTTLGRPFALGLMAGGRDRHGERVAIPVEGAVWKAQVTSPLFYDPQGARLDGE